MPPARPKTLHFDAVRAELEPLVHVLVMSLSRTDIRPGGIEHKFINVFMAIQAKCIDRDTTLLQIEEPD